MRALRRAALGLAFVVVAVVAGLPVYYAALGPEPPRLPEPGRGVELADGTRLNVLERGSGSAVVLVHGVPSSAYDWTPLPEHLARGGRRVITYDRKGWGHSDRRAADEAFTVDANSRELLLLLEALDLRGATLVGWSYGGVVVFRAAELDPSRVARLVFLASGPPANEDEGPGWFGSLLFSRPVLGWVARVPPVSEAITTALSRQAFSDQPMPEHWVPQVRANLSRPGTRRTQRAELRQFDPSVLHPESITCPVLVVLGTDDRLVSYAVSEPLYRSSFPHAEWLSVEGGSHMLPITHPELLSERILAFSAPGS